MKKNDEGNTYTPLLSNFKHIFRVMKLTMLSFLLCISSAWANHANSQTTRVNIHVENSQAMDIISQIEAQTNYLFVYNLENVDLSNKISLNAANISVAEVLKVIFKNSNVVYAVEGNNILLMKNETQASQQNGKRITGKVTDSKGGAIIGANVVEKGTTNGTTTDMDGNYSLNVSPSSVIQISYIGYITQEYSTQNKSSLNVALKEDTQALEEVVVVGYGTMKKSDLTGSIANVNQENIKNMTTATIDQKLVGQIAGVQIQQVSGAPGSGTSVKIRGAGSIGAGNEPLYVVDGMPYSSGFDQNLNPLSYISPNDIESITVLKDASSTAIYGSRGANGVVMITTKRGEFDKTEVNVSSKFGIQQVPQKGRPNMMNQYEFAEFQREKIGLNIRRMEKREPTNADYPTEYLPENLHGEGTNWYDLILRSALTQDHSVSVNKGSKESRLNFSLGYYNQQGVIKGTGMERFSGKLTMETKIGNVIKIGASLQPTFINQDRADVASGRDDLIGVATIANPVMKPYDNNGNLIPYIYSPKSKYHSAWGFMNPLFLLQETTGVQNDFQNLGIAFIEWEIIPELKVKSAINTNLSYSKYFQYSPSTIGSLNKPPVNGSGSSITNRGESFNWLIENTVTYDKIFAKKHKVGVLLGYTTQKSTSNHINLDASPYPNNLIETINAAQAIKSWGQGINEWSLISYLGRFNYAFDNKYLLTATFRSDGSSRFGKENRYAFFPSIATAWRVSEEGFMKNNECISDLKMRLSYGKSGNNNIGDYAHLASISADSYVFGDKQVTASTISLSNPFLTWEESSQVDVGVDMSFFNNRLSLVLDYYYKKSINMLLSDVIPAITGFNRQTVNKGNVRNTGFEISLNATPIQTDFVWNTNFNLSYNRNKVLSINNNENARIIAGNVDGNPTNITQVGEPIGQFIGYVFEGLYTKEDLDDPTVFKYPNAYEGAVKFKDVNNDGKISSPQDFEIMGNPHPDFLFGFSNNFSFKNFDLSIVINGQIGGDVISGMRYTSDNLQGYFNPSSEWVNRWKNPQESGDGLHYATPPSNPSYGHKISNLWVEDASYLRISNMALGYSFPNNLLKKTFIKSARLYVTAQNLATFTKYKGTNPEGRKMGSNNNLSPGIDMSSYPLARTLSFGLNLTF